MEMCSTHVEERVSLKRSVLCVVCVVRVFRADVETFGYLQESHGYSPVVCLRLFESLTALTFGALRKNHIVSTAFETVEKKRIRQLFASSDSHPCEGKLSGKTSMPDLEAKLGNHTGEQPWEAIKNVKPDRFELRYSSSFCKPEMAANISNFTNLHC